MGVRIIITNLLTHRYLLEKAAIISEIYSNPGWERRVLNLKKSFKAEIYSILIYVFAGGMLFPFFGKKPNFPHTYIGAFLVCIAISDAFFSGVLVYLFVKPVRDTVKMATAVQPRRSLRPANIAHLQGSYQNALIGSVLCVVSSTLLYINCVAGFAWPVYFHTKSTWIHYEVVGVNVDSICNDVGIFISAGMVRMLTKSSEARERDMRRKQQSNQAPDESLLRKKSVSQSGGTPRRKKMAA